MREEANRGERGNNNSSCFTRFKTDRQTHRQTNIKKQFEIVDGQTDKYRMGHKMKRWNKR